MTIWCWHAFSIASRKTQMKRREADGRSSFACPVQRDALTAERAAEWEAERAAIEAALAEVEQMCRERGLSEDEDDRLEEQPQHQPPASPRAAPEQVTVGGAGMHALGQDASLAALLCSEEGGLTAIDAAMEARGYRSVDCLPFSRIKLHVQALTVSP